MIEVRRAEPEDDAVLAGIDDATWSATVSPAPVPPPGRSFFGDHTGPEDVLVAVLDGVVVGYVAVGNTIPLATHAHVLELRGLAVNPSAARRGIGRRLVEAAVGEAVERGARKVTLRVLGSNAGARRLYAACGFAVEGVCVPSSCSAGATPTTCSWRGTWRSHVVKWSYLRLDRPNLAVDPNRRAGRLGRHGSGPERQARRPIVAEDLYTGCAEQVAASPELVRRLLRDHVPTTEGWCRVHGAHPERHPCSIRRLAELAREHVNERRRSRARS